MQNKGAIWTFTVLLTLACIWQLSFTWVASNVEKDAVEYANAQADSLNAVNNLSAVQMDSARQVYESQYLAKKSNEEVYPVFGYTYAECRKMEVNLGLDLQGGMHVTLEVSVPDLIKSMAGANNNDVTFLKIISKANELNKEGESNYVDLFEKAHQEVAPDLKLAAIFHNLENKETIPANATNEEVLDVIKTEAEEAISRTEQVLRKRVDNLGVVQPKIQRQSGSGRIVVELPGVKDKDRVRKILQGTAKLEFYTVYFNTELLNPLQQANDAIKLSDVQSKPEAEEEVIIEDSTSSNELESDLAVASDSAEAQEAEFEEFKKENPLFAVLNPNVFTDPATGQPYPSAVLGRSLDTDTAQVNEYLKRKDVYRFFPPRTMFAWSAKSIEGNEGKETNVYELYALIVPKGGEARIEGDVITDARLGQDEFGDAVVNMTMNPTGSRDWRELTREAAADNNRSVAVVLDGLVYSAPSVEGEIPNGSTRISGRFTQQEAKDLAGVLKAGKLPAPSHIIEEAVVGPSLGEASIDAGWKSFVIALLVVLIYMILFYNTAGFVADLALVSNIFFILGALASLKATLTLPGIAGIVLTIGMSVDANVLIYERIREELASGKNIKQAVADGYKSSYSSILDANITTLLTAIILLLFGSGPIQGFATTLIIGILSSLFSAIFITRLFFERWLSRDKKVSFSTKMSEGFLKGKSIDFIGKRKVYYVISGILVTVSLIALVTKGLNYGVDFVGGRTYIVKFDQPVNIPEMTKTLANAFVDEEGNTHSPEVKTYGSSAQVQITTKFLIDSTGNEVDDYLEGVIYNSVKSFYSDAPSQELFVEELTSRKVEPTIAEDLKDESVWAIGFALLVIGLYIWARFTKYTYSIGAIVAMAHDVIIVLGVFSLLYGMTWFNMEVDQAFIAAILTVVGYSINDTVVVFDRIREYFNIHPRRSREENVNSALNDTLSRTVNTSLSTFIVLLIIFLLGGEVIQGFIFALMTGVVIGTYSSVCVATPLMFDLDSKEDKKKK